MSSYPRQQADRLMKQRTTWVTGRGIQRNTYSETEITLRDRCTQTHIKTCTHMLQKVISVVTDTLKHRDSERDDRGVSKHTHVSSVRLTYEILTVAQHCNIVWKCQGFNGGPTGIKCTVNTHRAQSVLTKIYGFHLSHSMPRQTVFPKPRAAQQGW